MRVASVRIISKVSAQKRAQEAERGVLRGNCRLFLLRVGHSRLDYFEEVRGIERFI